MSFDLINAFFEFSGFLLVLPSLLKAYNLKMIRGVHIATPLFFLCWGVFNLFFYTHLDQWYSTLAAGLMIIGNLIWTWMVWVYSK